MKPATSRCVYILICALFCASCAGGSQGAAADSASSSETQSRDRLADDGRDHRGPVMPRSLQGDDAPPPEDAPECEMGLDCDDHPAPGCDGDDHAVRYRARCLDGECTYVERRERCQEGMICMTTFSGGRCVPEPDPQTDVTPQAEVDFSAQQLIINTNIRFDHASATLRSESAPILDEIAAALLEHPDARLRIEGHTDDTGTTRTNRELSKERARAVRDALVELGVEATRLEIMGHGESQPLVPNDEQWQRDVNRRVEFHLID